MLWLLQLCVCRLDVDVGVAAEGVREETSSLVHVFVVFVYAPACVACQLTLE